MAALAQNNSKSNRRVKAARSAFIALESITGFEARLSDKLSKFGRVIGKPTIEGSISVHFTRNRATISGNNQRGKWSSMIGKKACQKSPI